VIDNFSLNFRHLYAAVTIARIGSISRAAQAIHITQPALTNAVRKLEAQLNHKIFERRSHGVEPTPQGELFIAHVQDGLSRLAAAVQHLRESGKLKPLAFPERQVSSIQLRAFLAVLRSGGYTTAARDLGISQPSVYRAVRELQSLLGVPLFMQVGSYMRSAAHVQEFASDVRLAMANIQSGIDELAALHEPGAGRISIGSLPLARSLLLPRILARFSAAYPKVSVSVAEGRYGELVSNLRDGSIDMLFGALRSDFGWLDLQQRTLFHDELFVVSRANHPLATVNVTPRALAAYPWIIGVDNSPARKIWERHFLEAGIAKPRRCVECASIILARGLMIEGDWLGLMSAHQFKNDEENGVLTRIGEAVPGSVRPIGFTTRVNWRPTSAQAAFVAMAIEIAQSISE